MQHVSGRDRYIEEYLAHMATGGNQVVARPNRRRMLVLTAAFTPMIAVAALPVTAVVAVVASIVANVTARWVGLVVLVVAVVALGYGMARWAAKYDDVPATRGGAAGSRWRRRSWSSVPAWLRSCRGSHAPDPVIAALVRIDGVGVRVPSTGGRCLGAGASSTVGGRPRGDVLGDRVRVDAGLLLVAICPRSPRPRRVARRGRRGDPIPRRHTRGRLRGALSQHRPHRREPGCDLGFWITGWHEEDTRYLAHCVGHPKGDFTHLAGDWWQLADKQPPSNL